MYYVYAYLDPRKAGFFQYGSYVFRHEPFYIGKGKDLRLYQHIKDARSNKLGCNPHKIYKIQQILAEGLLPIVIKVAFYQTEEDAFLSEITLIHTIGRRATQTGPLTNIHEGGSGGDTITCLSTEQKQVMFEKYRRTMQKKKDLGLYVPPVQLFGKQNPMYKKGCVQVWKDLLQEGKITQEEYNQKYESWKSKHPKHLSDATKSKLSASLKQYYSKHKGKSRYGADNSFFGKKHTEETKRKLSEKAKGRHLSEETCHKMSEAHKGVKRPNAKKLFGSANPMYGRSFKDVWKARVDSGEWTQEQYEQRIQKYQEKRRKKHINAALDILYPTAVDFSDFKKLQDT